MLNALILDQNSEPAKLWRVSMPEGQPVTAIEVSSEELGPDDHESEITLAILPLQETISGLLTLPFNDKAKMSRLLRPELEDQLPFDCDQFAVTVRPTNLQKESEHLIAYSAAPRSAVIEAIDQLKSIGRDPRSILPGPTILNGIATRIPSCENGVALVFLQFNQWLITGVYLNGSQITGRNSLLRGNSPQECVVNIIQELYAIKGDLNLEPDQIALVNLKSDAQQVIQLAYQRISSKVLISKFELSDLIESTEEVPLAMLGALAAVDTAGDRNLNFRTGEFAFRPPLNELIRGLRSIALPILGVVIAIGVIVATIIMTRNYQISSLNEEIGAQIRQYASGVDWSSGGELSQMNSEIERVETELRNLGSADSSSALDAIAQLSEIFPQLNDTTVDKLSVAGARLSIEVCAPDFDTLERIEAALERKKVFAGLRKQALATCASFKPGGRGYKFEMRIKE